MTVTLKDIISTRSTQRHELAKETLENGSEQNFYEGSDSLVSGSSPAPSIALEESAILRPLPAQKISTARSQKIATFNTTIPIA